DLTHAHQAAAESLEIRQQLGERRSAALTLSRLANIRRREGDLSEARRMNEEAVTALKAIGDRGGFAMALFNLGLVLFDQGDVTRARSVVEEALAIRRQQHDKNNTAQAAAGLAPIAMAQDRLGEAGTLIAESTTLRQELGENIALADCKLIHSAMLLEQNDASGAERAAREAAATFQRASAWGREGEAAIAIARAQLSRGDAPGARTTLAAADKFVSDSKDARLRLWWDVTRARVLHTLSRKDEAAAILDRALEEGNRLGFVGMSLEIRLANVEAGKLAAAPLASEAQQAGFLLIARKAAH